MAKHQAGQPGTQWRTDSSGGPTPVEEGWLFSIELKAETLAVFVMNEKVS